MKKRLPLLPLIALIFSTLSCILQMDVPPTLGPGRVETFAAQTLAFYQYQTYVAMGTQAVPPAAETLAPPPTEAGAATATETMLPSGTMTGTPLPSSTFTHTITPTPLPCNWVQFISDVTIPDNWETTPLDHFTKTWRLKNIGSCTWTSGYSLVFDHGDQMGAPASQQLTTGTVPPNGTIDVSVDLLSPNAGGTYQGFFKLRASDSTVFGIGADANNAFWVKIKVEEPALPPPAVAPTTQNVYSQTSVPAGTVGHTTAACPSGTVVTGGGYSVSSNGMWVYVQRMNGNGWAAYVQNNSTLTKTLTAYAVCLAYPSVTTSSPSTNINVAGGDSANLTANCPSGSTAVGGGYTGRKEGFLIPFYSALSGNGWRVSQKNTSAGVASFTTYVVCLSGATASTSSVPGYVDLPPGASGYAESICPVGSVMTSGGWNSGTDLVVYYTSWYNGKWRVYGRNTGTHTLALTVRGTCLSIS
jgi:hypothetical protein